MIVASRAGRPPRFEAAEHPAVTVHEGAGARRLSERPRGVRVTRMSRFSTCSRSVHTTATPIALPGCYWSLMGSRPRELVSHYLAGRISEDELAKSLAAELRAEHEQTASDLAGRLLAILGRHRAGHLSEADVRLAVLPEASWAYRGTIEPASATRRRSARAS